MPQIKDDIKAPVIAINRHRIVSDGEGITTLVGFNGCPLRCRYCLNPICFEPNKEKMMLSASELYDKVKADNIYFLATRGGVTFGGGEPLLYVEFIRRFYELCGGQWHICAETSLNVPTENVMSAAECVDHFYIDCKDTDASIYSAYTGRDNSMMLKNLELLVERIPSDRITVRVPLIKDYNTDGDRQKSVERLKKLGIVNFDLFEYIVK